LAKFFNVAILNFHGWQQIFTTEQHKTFHQAVSLPKNQLYLIFRPFWIFKKFYFIKDEQLDKFKQSWTKFVKNHIQVLNDKNVLASILNLGAILQFHAWEHFFFQLKIFKKMFIYPSLKSNANGIDFCYLC
jgi:hypothetical protein